MSRLSRLCLPILLGVLAGLPAVGQEKVPAPPVPPAPAPVPPPPAPNAVAATVNGQTVPEMAVYRALRPLPAPKRAEARVEIVNYLIDNILIDQYLKEQKIEAPTTEVDARVAEMQRQLRAQSLDFVKVLSDMMLTEAELRE